MSPTKQTLLSKRRKKRPKQRPRTPASRKKRPRRRPRTPASQKERPKQRPRTPASPVTTRSGRSTSCAPGWPGVSLTRSIACGAPGPSGGSRCSWMRTTSVCQSGISPGGTTYAFAIGCVFSRGTRTGCWPWPSAPTARPSPPRASTGRCGCGTRRPARPAPPSRGTRARCGPWPSAPTARPSPRRQMTRRCGCGTRRPARPTPPSRGTRAR